MTFYSPAQIFGNSRAYKARMFQQSRTNASFINFRVDVQFVKALGKVWLLVIPCLFLFYSVVSVMVSDVADSVISIENINYQLLTSNLELREKTELASATEVIKERAAEIGLYEHKRGQLRVYRVNRNYFSYQ